MPKLIERLTSVRREEVGALTWALVYGFCIFLAYYILRPVRDEISSADRGNLQILWTVVFLVMLVAVPAYSWVVARWPRETSPRILEIGAGTTEVRKLIIAEELLKS